MNNHTETRLTDYALNELDDAERRDVEQLLETDADARRTVDDTAALAMMLRTATTTGVGNDVGADAALRAKLLERMGAAGGSSARESNVGTVLTIGTGGQAANGTHNSRTAIWAAAASIAVLCTSVGAIAMFGNSADERRASSLAITIDAERDEYQPDSRKMFDAGRTLGEASKGRSDIHQIESAESLSGDRGGKGEEGGGQKSNALPRNMPEFSSYGGNSKALPYGSKSAAEAASSPSPGLPTSDYGPAPVSAQPLVSEIPRVETFNYSIGSTAANTYSGNTVVNGGTLSLPASASPQPGGPVILSPTPQPNNLAVQSSVAEQSTGRFMLGVGVNSNAGLVGSIVTDGRAQPGMEPSGEKWNELEREKTLQRQNEHFNTEAYDAIVENAFLKTADAPLSTFSIDVDTASYSNVRRFLNGGQLPPKSAVRLEEFINYFTYEYPQPTGDDPFAVTTEAARCPWNGEHVLVRVGLKGKEIHRKERPATNLVFLVDVSGSMDSPNKLPLVRESLKLLVNELGDSDRVAMVVYAGNSGLVLPSTGGDRKQTILEAIDNLDAGGSTNGASGINLAYQVATENFIKGGVNRVVLATDGDFNVGVTNQGDLVTLIEAKAKTGVFFSALGYGMGNLKDSTLEKLSDKGNGNYAYIDTLAEARKVLVEQMSGTLVTIAKDVKIQIEFNPQRVAAYRLLGYENRMLAAQDFNDDKKDAGEIGAGHTVTALYELIPARKDGAKETAKLPTVDPLKYQQPTAKNEPTDAAKAAELLTLKLRYKQPDGDVSKLIERPLADDVRSYAQASGDFKFASAVATFGMMLRESKYRGSATYDAVLELAQEGIGEDRGGYRAEFVELVRKAKGLGPQK